MRYNLRKWAIQAIAPIWPRLFRWTHLPVIKRRSVVPRRLVMLGSDIYMESRESPTALAGPNPLPMLVGASAMTSLVAGVPSSVTDESWHLTISDSFTLGWITNPPYQTNAPEVSANGPAQGTDTPRSGEIQNAAANWAAFSSGD